MIFLSKWVILRWTMLIFRGVKDLKGTTWRLLFETDSELSSFFGPAAISRWRSCTSGEWQQRQSTSLCWTWKLTTMLSGEHVKFCRKYQRQFNKQERERERLRLCKRVCVCVCVCAVLSYLYIQYRFHEYPCCASFKLYICNCTSPCDSMIFLLVAFFLYQVSLNVPNWGWSNHAHVCQLWWIRPLKCIVWVGSTMTPVDGWCANKNHMPKKEGPPKKSYVVCICGAWRRVETK